MFGFYVYCFWIGAKLVDDGFINKRSGVIYTAGDLLACLIGIIMGMMMFLSVTPNLQAIFKAKVVGKFIYDVIERQPEVNNEQGS